MNTLKEAYSTHDAVSAALDGKYSTDVTATPSMAVNSTTFVRESIVKVTSALTISSVLSLDYEVVFEVDANVAVTLTPTDVPTIGTADVTKKRLYSFLKGNLVVGNFN